MTTFKVVLWAAIFPIAFSGVGAAPVENMSGVNTTVVSLSRDASYRRYERYVLGPGDVINVKIYLFSLDNATTTNISKIQIDPSGKLVLPFVGEITASGFSCEELASRLIEALKKDYRNPYVTIELVKTSIRSVTIVGDFLNGIYQLRRGERLFSLLARNSTSKKPFANYDLIQITRDDGVIDIDVQKFITGNDTLNNPVLEAGDRILIKSNEVTITILGEVHKPGIYTVKSPLSLIDAVAKAGGFTNGARVERIYITHKDGMSQDRVDVNKFFKSADSSANPLLKDGDTVYVPKKVSLKLASFRDMVWVMYFITNLIILLW